MSTAPTPTVLLVARPDDAEAIAQVLVGAGFSAPAIAYGGDDTLTLCDEVEPDVVVLCATLEQGDARSLAAALKASAGGPELRIVLVGDAGGPIRNALDASDFDVDRFVGRPLAAKALLFAVRSCAAEVEEAAAKAARDTAPGPSRPSPRPLPPPPSRQSWPPILRTATMPGTGPGLRPGPVLAAGKRPPGMTSPGVEAAMEEAIARFVHDAMNAFDFEWSIDPDRDDPAGAAGEGPSARHSAPGSHVGAIIRAAQQGAVAVAGAPPARGAERSAAETPASEGASGAGPDEPAWREAPAPPAWREPTLILSGGGQAPAGSGAPSSPQAADVTEPQQMDAAGQRDTSPVETRAAADSAVDGDASFSLHRAGSGNGLAAADSSKVQADELDAGDAGDDAEPRRPGGDSAGEAALASEPPAHEDGSKSPLGRELRRKMSMMAERLFPGRAGDRSRLDVGLVHDAHAEIDLMSIGMDEEVSGPGGTAADEALGGVDTFTETNPLSRLEPTPPASMAADDGDEATGRRRSMSSEPPSRGDLADIDVATLLGRLLQNRFTGRAHFRRGAAEKTIHFEDGRPVFAVSNLPHDRMGDLLYREGKITRDQQQRARDLVMESGRRMGEILVEIGFLKPRELLPAVRHHIEDIAYSLFAWDTGEFAIVSGDPTSERIRLTRHPAAIVLEGVRRKYGAELLEARLGSPAAVVAVRSQRELGAIAAVADLSPSERAVIQKLDGERTIQQSAEAAQVDHLVALQLAFALIALGVAEVVDHGPSSVGRPPIRSRSLIGQTDIAIDRQRVLAKHALVHEADYFTLLGVRRDATAFEIRRAYEAAHRDYAVSGFPTELQRELAGELGEINRVIDEAYQVLRDDQVRRSYQANLLD